ncbi:MAG: homoserine kinase [Limnochordales bacterium]|nr:homoserine kinase [Limnochordales bacterium]
MVEPNAACGADAQEMERARACLIKVPATTANLGPGFDILGLTLDLYNEVVVERLARGLTSGGMPDSDSLPVEIEIRGVGAAGGADQLPRGADNLLVQALLAGWQLWQPGVSLPAVRLVCTNRVPPGSGLGSSSTAVVAGLVAAAWLAGRLPVNPAGPAEDGWSRPGGSSKRSDSLLFLLRPEGVFRDLLDLGIALEGHPDNLAAALFGGLTAAAEIERQGVREWSVARVAPAGEVWAAVVTPRFVLRTSVSRSVLPKQVSWKDAVFNMAQLSWLLLAAAAGDWQEVGAAMNDRLHQPYRVPLVPGLEQVLAASRAAGAWGAALSGSGPSVVALAPDRATAERVAGAMQEAFAAAGVKATGLAVRAGVPGALALFRPITGLLPLASG